jgi:hypothetical protein
VAGRTAIMNAMRLCAWSLACVLVLAGCFDAPPFERLERGMTQREVRNLMGNPAEQVREPTNSFGIAECWYYGEDRPAPPGSPERIPEQFVCFDRNNRVVQRSPQSWDDAPPFTVPTAFVPSR